MKRGQCSDAVSDFSVTPFLSSGCLSYAAVLEDGDGLAERWPAVEGLQLAKDLPALQLRVRAFSGTAKAGVGARLACFGTRACSCPCTERGPSLRHPEPFSSRVTALFHELQHEDRLHERDRAMRAAAQLGQDLPCLQGRDGALADSADTGMRAVDLAARVTSSTCRMTAKRRLASRSSGGWAETCGSP